MRTSEGRDWPYVIGQALLALLGAGMIASTFFVEESDAHTAPSGWSYPFACCSNADCREVGDSQSKAKIKILETPQGYKISSTGEVVPYSGDTRLRESPDGEFHWCSVAGKDDSRTLCLFAPPRSY